MSKKIFIGHTGNNDKFYERYSGKTHVLAQQNRLGAWHGYINQILKTSFSCEQDAAEWVKNWKAK